MEAGSGTCLRSFSVTAVSWTAPAAGCLRPPAADRGYSASRLATPQIGISAAGRR
jgi:hypothetical protein